jgi:transcriptional adapter 2-alpha
MGLIMKPKGAPGSGGAGGGVKFICNKCSNDITNTVRIRCHHTKCKDYDLCVTCFSEGEKSENHDPCTHPYNVIEPHSIPIFDEGWGADEELLLLEGAEQYGLGSWADVADHIGNFREKDEVRDHYINTYVNSSKFPLPERASPNDTTLSDSIPREEFQVRKKRRIEERKEIIAATQITGPLQQKPTSSVPSCHEVAGYMPGRLEFETEHLNEAEEAVQHMQFSPEEGYNPQTGAMEPELDLKMVVMGVYNDRLTARTDRKRVIFNHRLLDYRKNTAIDKKRTKDQRDLHHKLKPFAIWRKNKISAKPSHNCKTGAVCASALSPLVKSTKPKKPLVRPAQTKHLVNSTAWQAASAATEQPKPLTKLHKQSQTTPPKTSLCASRPQTPPHLQQTAQTAASPPHPCPRQSREHLYNLSQPSRP